MLYKSKGFPRQAEVAQGVPGRLRPRTVLTFRYYKGGRSSAKRTSRLRAHGSVGDTMEKIPSDTTGNRSRDRPTSSAVP